MKKLFGYVFGGLVACGAVACGNASSTPSSTPAAGGTAVEAQAAGAAASPSGGVVAVGSVGTAAAKMPFNVLMISIDSMRADMPWAGYPRPIAPRLTELEKRAISYTHAYSISSFTSKSLGGFLGGRLPSELERTPVFFTSYLPQNVMFPEVLTEQGVHTLAGHGHFFFDKAKGHSGMDQGFADWRVVPGFPVDYNTDPAVSSHKLTPMAIEMLSDPKNTSGRFFAWFHYMDPHERYLGHEESPHFGKKARDLYDEEVFYTDLWVGKLLDFVEQQPWGKQTAIIVTADHGEAFGEHHLFRHAFELYDVLVHVPLFVVVPGQPGKRIDAFRDHIDLVPTIFDLIGAKPNPELRGTSFAPELLGAEPGPSRDVICDLPEDSYNERRRALIHDNWKIIAFGNDVRYELYNLANDPDEKEDLFKKDPEHMSDMLARYKAMNQTVHEAPIKGGVPKPKNGEKG